jgi:hypothetical protein
MGPRSGLDTIKKNVLPLMGVETQSSNMQPAIIETELPHLPSKKSMCYAMLHRAPHFGGCFRRF